MTQPPADVLFAIERPNDLFYQRNGQPVWPVRNDREREALVRMVTTLGGTVKFLEDAEEATLSGPELVVGLGPDAYEHARLYAHLTSRSCIMLQDTDELSKLTQFAVVVTTFAHVNECLLDLMYGGEQMTAAPGLIFSYDRDDLPLQVIARSAARHCNNASFQHRRVDVNPTIDYGVDASPDYIFVGGSATPSAFRDALSCTAGALTFHTHSDGIDAYLRTDLVLCPIVEPDARDQPTPWPSCVLSGTCHRCNRPMADVLGTDVLLAPEIVKAHVFIYCVCWGLYPSPGIHSPAFALSRRFLQSFTIGAMLTSWEINVQKLPVTARLFHDVARGLPLGQALARHLSSDEARLLHHRLCLIGDPAMRLSQSDIQDPLDGIQAIPTPSVPTARCIAGLSLLRLMVHQHARPPQDPPAVLTTCTEYETMLVAGRPRDPALAARFRREMMAFLAGHDTMLSKSWAQFVDTTEVLPDKPPCPTCGRRTIVRLSRLRIPGAVSRVEAMCPSCGSVEDSPADRRMSLTVAPDGLMQLHGDLPGSDWRARVTVERFFTRETDGWDWPSGPAGDPLHSFRAPKPWPVVPFRVSLIMLHGDCDVSVLGCLYRGQNTP